MAGVLSSPHLTTDDVVREEAWKQILAEYLDIEALPEGTTLLCPFGIEHDERCLCGGSGTFTREARLADLDSELEILAK